MKCLQAGDFELALGKHSLLWYRASPPYSTRLGQLLRNSQKFPGNGRYSPQDASIQVLVLAISSTLPSNNPGKGHTLGGSRDTFIKQHVGAHTPACWGCHKVSLRDVFPHSRAEVSTLLGSSKWCFSTLQG